MRVISINSLPKFDIKLHDEFNRIMPSVINREDAINNPLIEIEYPSDWRSFIASNEPAEVTILNSQNKVFDNLIDFENKALCEKIEYLTIGGAIGNLSEKIKQLVNLRYLRVFDVSSISPAISSLKKLEELFLEHCYRLEFIPFEIYEIQSLKKLTINNLGYYENLSPRINRLVNLELLTLKEHFPLISEEISQLSALKALDIEKPNQHVYQIPNLEALRFKIFDSSLLKGINKLSHLKELWLDIREFNDELNGLTSLKYLIISNFDEEVMPDLRQLYNLELLVLHCCSNLTSIPDFVFNLPNLKYLGLRFLNKLTALSPEINNISSLKYLEISNEEETDTYELPDFRRGLFVYKLNSWNSYERIH